MTFIKNASVENAAERKSYIGEIFNIGANKQKAEILNNLSIEHKNLHSTGVIHIHDLEAYGTTYNCLVLDFLKSFSYGKYKEFSDSRKILSIFSYIKKTLVQLGQEQSGGMSFANFDKELAHIFNELKLTLTEENKISIKDGLFEFIQWCSESHDRAGQVSWYITLNIGLAVDNMGRYIAYTLIDEFENSAAHYFRPNIVFKVKDGINYQKMDSNYDIFKKSLLCTSKKMIPTYFLCDSKINKNYDSDTLAIVGCRTKVTEDLYGPSGTIGRGNLANITINLPRLALEAIQNDTESHYELFVDKWNSVANSVTAILLDRYKKLLQLTPQDFTVNSRLDLWCEDFSKVSNLEDIFRHGTLSIGFIGLSEAIEILTKEKFYSTNTSHELAFNFVTHMREYCDKMIKKHQLNFSLLATSGELIAGKFCEKDAVEFPHKVHEKGFYTNSFHIDVDSQISAFKKIKLEGKFHTLCNGGCITYIEMNEAPLGNNEALYELIEHSVKNEIVYLGFNFPLDVCEDCETQGVFDICPNCNNPNITRIRRVSGYLEILDHFTSGKKNETLARKKN